MTGVKTHNFTDAATGKSVSASYVTDGVAKMWANLNGSGTPAYDDSFNVSSVTDNSTGVYTHNFTNSMSNALYAPHNSGSIASGITSAGGAWHSGVQQTSANSAPDTMSTSALKVGAGEGDTSAHDVPDLYTTVHGDLA